MRSQLHLVLTWLLALLFLGFSVPKLIASEVSLALFAQINRFTGLEGRGLMYFVGALELSVGLVLVLSLLLGAGGYRLWLLGLALAIGTMLGAIFTELVIRPGEDLILLVLAFVILSLSLYLLWPRRSELLALVPGLGRTA